jgi:uncharacterized protein (TIGR02285 family)
MKQKDCANTDSLSMNAEHLFLQTWRCTTLLPLIVLLSLFLPRVLHARDEVTWMEASMPPFFIQEGPDQGQGYGDVVTAILHEHLPEYVHHRTVTNVTKHFRTFKRGDKVCSVGLYRNPEREELMYFSIPSFLTLPPVLITSKEKLASFGEGGMVRLEDILKDAERIIGLSKDRSYGADIDAVLDAYRERDNLVVFTGQELTENFFKMLMLDRIDALIGLPEEAMYMAEKLGIRDRIAILAIAENQGNPHNRLCSVGCSKTPWGKEIIAKINTILLEQRPGQQYRAAYERWLDAGSVEEYRRVYDEVFLRVTE